MNIKTQYDREPSPGTINNKPSKTMQHFANEANINTIMERAMRTGMIGTPEDLARKMNYIDVSKNTDFLEIHQNVMRAQRDFLQIPSKIRKHFRNNVAEMLMALDDPNRRDELEKIGLLKPKPVTRLDVTGTTDTKVSETPQKQEGTK